MKKITSIFNQHLADDTFSVDTFCREAGVSRAQLYRRVKALTGQSPNQLLRSTRIKRAAVLLRNRRLTISEVAYRVGFSSMSYFTKCFKREFGRLPSQFRDQL